VQGALRVGAFLRAGGRKMREYRGRTKVVIRKLNLMYPKGGVSKNPSIRERWQAGRTRTDLPFPISSRASRWLSMKRWERFSARGTRHSDRIRTQPSRSSMNGSIRWARPLHECYLSPGAPDCVCEEERRPHVIGRKVKAKEAKAKAKPYWLLPCG
jgi:hypothetical protein